MSRNPDGTTRTLELDFDGRRGIILEPRWLAAQFRRVKPGDAGLARALARDDFPVRRRAVGFELARKGPQSARVRIAPEASAPAGDERPRPFDQAIEIAREVLKVEFGAVAVLGEERAVEALTSLRERAAIERKLTAELRPAPGLYEVVVREDRRAHHLWIEMVSLPRTGRCDADEEDLAEESGAPIEIEIGDALDLHAFSPKDVRAVVEEYCRLAAERGFAEVRVIHGRGIGEMRRLTRAVLDSHPSVVSYRDAPHERGGPGATLARLDRERGDGGREGEKKEKEEEGEEEEEEEEEGGERDC
jgi:DNA-nicking Smr family endonuclease